ncbi:uncharacterized protein C8Q71DRAFT_862658 [Rhodofomes roseus]|uniref:MYND-type domain-containing protein n=1 Tax=Rhodofomes roseus TaxID=34475 RepID=A0ABQ8K1P4_9APHY|nr:uncharacterized protein C8Q71DRAFT_862658 [Rhodofomes roseus]KAH9830368.1 hypothetical protein C8Q71DRAFT_862658 [Rhodofomes roseus]
MSEQFYFLTHTPEQAAKWDDIARTDPERVCETLDVGFETKTTNRWGDSAQDVYPCYEATGKLAREGTAEWHRLLDVGVAEKLCDGVLQARVYVPPLPGMSEERQREAMRQVRSGHFVALDAICHAVCSVSKTPNESERKFLRTLKQRWPEMMKHLWDSPQNALRPESSHAIERAVVAKIVARLTHADPSVMSMIDADFDMTLPLLTRYFIHATEERDTLYLLECITCLTTPIVDKDLIKHRKLHPLPKTWLSRMMGGSTPPRKIFDRCGVHLTQTMKKEEDARMIMDFIITLLQLVNDQGPEFANDLRQSASLWTNMFIFMRRAAERKIEPGDKAAGARAKRAAANVIGLTANWMHSCFFQSPDQLKVFVELCIRADFFNALDATVPRVVATEGVTQQLTRIIFCLDSLLSKDPSTSPLFKGQLPRPRTFHALLIHAYIDPRTRSLRTPSEFVRTGQVRRDAKGLPAVGSNFFDESCWQMWHALEKRVKSGGVCARRVCDERATARCSKCGQAQYCGQDCQKKDWKEHKIMCGVIIHDEVPNSGGLHRVTIPGINAPPVGG